MMLLRNDIPSSGVVLRLPIRRAGKAIDQAVELCFEEPIYFAYCLLVKNHEAFAEVLNCVQQDKLYLANGILFEEEE